MLNIDVSQMTGGKAGNIFTFISLMFSAKHEI